MAQEPGGTAITGLFVDVSHLHHDSKSNGDTWDYIWADDDNIYSFGCDGAGYGAKGRNVNFNKLTGNQWDILQGSSVNTMDDFGRDCQKWPDGATWKVTGGDCIDGVIYAFIAGNWYGCDPAFGGKARDTHLRQTSNNMSLIKSTDHGVTWVRPMKEEYDHPMWTNPKFSTAFFFKFGQNGGSTTQDAQDKYVYAISNNGYWNCGSAFYLGRVSRSKIGDLNVADWEYLSDGSWTSDLDKATPVPGFPNGEMKCTCGSPIWLAGLKKYVTVTWYDPGNTTKWHYPVDVYFAFYQADHPWGPWSYIGQKSADEFIGDPRDRIHRWYGPSLSAKFITNNPDRSVSAILTFSGQTWENKPDSLYKNNSCPVTFYVKPSPRYVALYNDTDAKYSDGWVRSENRGMGDIHDDVHSTAKQGSSCDFTFTGEGIEIISEKYHDMGDVEVLLDGVSQGTFHLYQDPMPRLYQIPFYRNMSLTPGQHTVRVVNQAPDGTFCLIDAFKVYRSRNDP